MKIYQKKKKCCAVPTIGESGMQGKMLIFERPTTQYGDLSNV